MVRYQLVREVRPKRVQVVPLLPACPRGGRQSCCPHVQGQPLSLSQRPTPGPQLLCHLSSTRNCWQAGLGVPGPAGRQERGTQGRRGRCRAQQATL